MIVLAADKFFDNIELGKLCSKCKGGGSMLGEFLCLAFCGGPCGYICSQFVIIMICLSVLASVEQGVVGVGNMYTLYKYNAFELCSTDQGTLTSD